MIKSIGESAGIVWAFLNENGETTLTKLKKETGLTSDMATIALGWLAREEKINIDKKGTSVKISLL